VTDDELGSIRSEGTTHYVRYGRERRGGEREGGERWRSCSLGPAYLSIGSAKSESYSRRLESLLTRYVHDRPTCRWGRKAVLEECDSPMS